MLDVHPDCADRCKILEHKGYHDCTNTGRCELLEAMTSIEAAERRVEREGWVMVPRERSYDERIAVLRAFNQCNGDLDDKLEAVHQAMLSARERKE